MKKDDEKIDKTAASVAVGEEIILGQRKRSNYVQSTRRYKKIIETWGGDNQQNKISPYNQHL